MRLRLYNTIKNWKGILRIGNRGIENVRIEKN